MHCATIALLTVLLAEEKIVPGDVLVNDFTVSSSYILRICDSTTFPAAS